MRIGIFDSGVGGLTVSKEVAIKMPFNDIIYFGDSIHLPYGNKSIQNILTYSRNNVQFLIEKKCQIIVVACNTSTAVAIEILKKEFHPLPIFGVIEGGVREALKKSKSLKIGVLGTLRTIKSSSYKNKILQYSPQAKVYEVASPLLVPIIEEGFKHKAITIAIIKSYLEAIVLKIDSLILGCTHYPLIKKLIKTTYPELQIIDSAKATSSFLAKKIPPANPRNRKIEIITNDDNEVFRRIAKKIFPKEKVTLLKNEDST